MENTIRLLLHDWCNPASNRARPAWALPLHGPPQRTVEIRKCQRPYPDHKSGNIQFCHNRTHHIYYYGSSFLSPFNTCYGRNLSYRVNGRCQAWDKDYTGEDEAYSSLS